MVFSVETVESGGLAVETMMTRVIEDMEQLLIPSIESV